MNALKEIYQYIDLYGDSVFLYALKSKFKAAAYRPDSIPGPGSPCVKSEKIKDGAKVKKAIFHNTGEITVKLETCGQSMYFRFF